MASIRSIRKRHRAQMACAIEARKLNAMARRLAMGVVERAIERAQARVAEAVARSHFGIQALLVGAMCPAEGSLSAVIRGDGSGVALPEISEQ